MPGYAFSGHVLMRAFVAAAMFLSANCYALQQNNFLLEYGTVGGFNDELEFLNIGREFNLCESDFITPYFRNYGENISGREPVLDFGVDNKYYFGGKISPFLYANISRVYNYELGVSPFFRGKFGVGLDYLWAERIELEGHVARLNQIYDPAKSANEFSVSLLYKITKNNAVYVGWNRLVYAGTFYSGTESFAGVKFLY